MEERKDQPGEKAGRIYTVRLEDMEFRAFHGVLPEEREEGNIFMVSLEFDYSSSCAETDDILHALDYGKAYALVEAIMRVPRKLLETLARDICERFLDAFPEADRVEATVRKKNPPVGGKCAWSAVRTEEHRK